MGAVIFVVFVVFLLGIMIFTAFYDAFDEKGSKHIIVSSVIGLILTAGLIIFSYWYKYNPLKV